MIREELDEGLEAAFAREATRRRSTMPAGAIGGEPLQRQVGGSHYTDMKIQPFEFSMANGLNACQHTAIKYITRTKGDRIEDLNKAIHTLEIYIEMIKQGIAE